MPKPRPIDLADAMPHLHDVLIGGHPEFTTQAFHDRRFGEEELATPEPLFESSTLHRVLLQGTYPSRRRQR